MDIHRFWMVASSIASIACGVIAGVSEAAETKATGDYVWTTDHLQVGVRWQPYSGRPQNNAYDVTRPVIATDSSYVQFWMAWSALEPTRKNTDYRKHPSTHLKIMEQAVDACRKRGLKVEFVFFHCPAWASVSGQAGGQRPQDGLFPEFARRIASHFKGRVDAYQLSHEVNLQGLMEGGDVDFLIEEVFIRGGQAIRDVYAAEPAEPATAVGYSPRRRGAPFVRP